MMRPPVHPSSKLLAVAVVAAAAITTTARLTMTQPARRPFLTIPVVLHPA